MPDLTDRARGALLGLAVGDALGAPVEFLPRGTFPPVTGMQSGGRFDLPAGAWTDDTTMALCLAESLLAHREFHVVDTLNRFCRWAEHGENSSTGRAVGIGQYTLYRLGEYRRTGDYPAPPMPGGRSDGNGALMRVAPTAIRHWRDHWEAGVVAMAQSRATHCSELSKWACTFTARLIARLIAGEPWEGAVSEALETVPIQICPEIHGRVARRHSETEPPSTGFALDTLEAALWAVERSTCFADAVLTAVNLGHDADTTGAVAGQIAGARYGAGSIPADWLDALAQRRRIDGIAERLLEMG